MSELPRRLFFFVNLTEKEIKSKKEREANLSTLPDEVVDNMKLVLKGAKVSMNETIPDNFEVIRSRPHGHVMVILETIKKCGMHRRFPAGF
ncbi:MAG: hypothetical protein QNJ33_12010 [Crocosphaera sp.]|nr:hypothetical protein [Crocosphaera sp.]